jgi:hypothetical protein
MWPVGTIHGLGVLIGFIMMFVKLVPHKPTFFFNLTIFGFFCTNTSFAVLFQKLDPWLGAIIIGT